jgi:peptidoglycan/LPS O-acetylase OafA/YrhL
MTSGGATLESAFNPRRNSLNALRLLMALLVIVSHSWPIGGFGGGEPRLGDETIGGWAVAGFFAISGYLITGSRAKSQSLGDYMWRRLLRIYPAFLVAILVTAFVFAPISAALSPNDSYTMHAGADYILRNFLIRGTSAGIDGTLTNVPIPGVWNGSLWTLHFEVGCYIVIGFVISVLPRKLVTPAVVALFLMCTAVTAVRMFGHVAMPFSVAQGSRLLAVFLAGSLVYFWRERIRVSLLWSGVATTVLVVLVIAHGVQTFGGLPIAYLMMTLGAVLPLSKVGARNDISYGVYILAFPVQQSLALADVQRFGVWALIALATLGTIPLAYLSRLLVETPCDRYRHMYANRVSRRPLA